MTIKELIEHLKRIEELRSKEELSEMEKWELNHLLAKELAEQIGYEE